MKLIYIIVGIVFCSISLFFFIIYLNLLTMGYTFLDFGKFISKKVSSWLLPLGILFIYKGLRKEKKNELLL